MMTETSLIRQVLDLEWEEDQDVVENQHIQLVTKDPAVLRLIWSPSYSVCLAAVQLNGMSLQHVPEIHRTAELCMAAVKQNGNAMWCVPPEKQTEELKLMAVNNCGRAIHYIENPSDEVQIAAIQNDTSAFYLIENPSDEIVCLHALMGD